MIVGMIGAGNMAIDMAKAFNEQKIAIKTICDIDREKGQRLAKAFNSEFQADYHKLLADEKIDLIYIATPPKTHAEIFIKALEAKKHTLCEKPLCLNEEDAQKMLEAANNAQKFSIISSI